MFNSTHTLAGLALSRTGLDRWTPHATWTAVIASNLPDIDIITQLGGTASYIAYHRGITHTLLGVPLLSLLLAGVMWKISGNFARTFIIAVLVMATHPALDYANTYGIRPFTPIHDTWYYGDALFVIDPFLDSILAATLVAGNYFKVKRRGVAMAGLGVALVYIGVRVQLRDIAREHLSEFTASVVGFQRSAVSPRMETPFVWTGIVETSEADFSVAIDVIQGVTAELARMPKGDLSPTIEHARSARAARVFMGFARFPFVRVDQLESGYRVHFLDFRFYRETTGTAFGAEILLDKSLRVISEEMGFTQRVND